MSSTSLCCFPFFSHHGDTRSTQQQLQQQHPPLIAAYHEPPPSIDNSDSANDDDYYTNNPTPFGRILAGELPSRTYLESSELLAFRDRSPKASFHALVIPKQYVKDIYSLRGVTRYSDKEQRDNKSQENSNDIQLIQNMRQMGLDLLQQYQPEALAAEDYILCFHIPPFNSVDHLHLHVLAPASEMNWVYREIKYKCGARWCTSDLEVIERLMAGLPAVRYQHPSQC